MESSNIGYQKWVIAIYLMLTSQKGVSNLKLHQNLGIMRRSAGHLAHRMRDAFGPVDNAVALAGPVEVGEVFSLGRKTTSMPTRSYELVAVP